MLLEYLDARILPGYVGLRSGAIQGYAFSVFEASKAVIGDVYALNETEAIENPLCDTMLDHLIETLQNTPGIDRIESQLLMFPAGALHRPFLGAGFRAAPRLFMLAELQASPSLASSSEFDGPRVSPVPFTPSEIKGMPALPANFFIHPWQPEIYEAAAALIHRCYKGHMDAGINDQYRTLHGAQRFLHNIIRFPGCGVFDPDHSLALRDRSTGAIVGLILCSRIRSDVGHITQLCIEPALRGQGLGQHLLAQCASHLAERGVAYLSLTVTEANTSALRLYEKQGFRTLHRFEAMVWDKAFSA
jgi:ribosomal protein S18 acetylase RimI-like enzyme